MAIIIVSAAVVTIVIGISGCIKWIYRLVQKSTEVQGEVIALKASVEEIKTELESMRARRPWRIL
jgi:outer membrane murein-binding lipoprotein Lpp